MAATLSHKSAEQDHRVPRAVVAVVDAAERTMAPVLLLSVQLKYEEDNEHNEEHWLGCLPFQFSFCIADAVVLVGLRLAHGIVLALE